MNHRTPAGLTSEELRTLLRSSLTAHASNELALLHVLQNYVFRPGQLQRLLLEQQMNVNFSKLTHWDIASFAQLDPVRPMNGIPTFELYRSRIPTGLFKSIVQDMDMMIMQYGPPNEHEHEEATSEFLSPIFNRLVAQFGFAIRNARGPIISNSRCAIRGRAVQDTERMDAIAQILAECFVCNWHNSQHKLTVPMYAILRDRTGFQFFQFDDTQALSFCRGAFEGDPVPLRRGFYLPDFTREETTGTFICSLREICETVFDILLLAYATSVRVQFDRNTERSQPQDVLDRWENSMARAEEAQEAFQDAAIKNKMNDRAGATQAVQCGMVLLQQSVGIISTLNPSSSIMKDWCELEVEMA